MRQAAAAVGLTTAEAQAGVVRANAAKWPPTTSRYWWTQATAAYTRMNFGQRVKLCPCCQARGMVAPLTPVHVSAECPEWNTLWAWVTTTLRKTGAALPAGVTRAQWLLFGHGAARGVKAVVDKLAIAGRQVRATGARRPKLGLAKAGQTGVAAATRPLTAPSYGNGGARNCR